MSSESQAGSPSVGPSLAETERSAARYLFAISVLAESRTDRVSTGDLTEYLGVAAASVTEMVAKLDDRDLVEYEKYQGVTLTDRGERVATQAGWRCCVVATFFESVLDTTLDEETAFDIGFVLPKTGVFRLRTLVDSACLRLCPESSGDSERCVA